MDKEWLSLAPPPGQQGIAYSLKGILESDIPLPRINSISGAAKFADDGTDNASAVRFGYKVFVDVAPLELSNVPLKYKNEGAQEVGIGKNIRSLPIEQVTYDANFHFAMKDADGFTLLALSSARHVIQSGRVNSFQAFVDEPVLRGIAKRTKQVVFNMTVGECITCR